MTTGVTLEKTESKFSCYVYYDEWTGSIMNISNTELEDSEYPSFYSENLILKNIISGVVNEKQYLVSFNEDNDLDVIEKDNVIRLRSSENTLTQLIKQRLTAWDIRVKLYTGNNRLLVEINQESIRRLSNMTFNKTLQIEEDNDLALYIIKHNNPDFFVQKLDIDVNELLETGNNIFDISSLRKYISLQDIGILTRRCFKNYYMEVLDESLDVVSQSLVKNLSYIHRTNYVGNTGHIIAEQNKNIVTFSTKLSSGELTDLGLHEDKLWMYIVGDSPDEYYGSIPVNIRDLKNKKRTNIRIEGKLADYNILHKKHKLVLTIKE